MPKANAKRRLTIPPIVAAVVQLVAKRLSRIEALLIEMRHEQDRQLKRVAALRAQLDRLTYEARVKPRAKSPGRFSHQHRLIPTGL
jgi:hypothetical protein